MLVGFRLHTRPVDGETVSDSETVPVNPLTADAVMVEVPGDPTVAVTLVGLAARVKSGVPLTV